MRNLAVLVKHCSVRFELVLHVTFRVISDAVRSNSCDHPISVEYLDFLYISAVGPIGRLLHVVPVIFCKYCWGLRPQSRTVFIIHCPQTSWFLIMMVFCVTWTLFVLAPWMQPSRIVPHHHSHSSYAVHRDQLSHPSYFNPHYHPLGLDWRTCLTLSRVSICNRQYAMFSRDFVTRE